MNHIRVSIYETFLFAFIISALFFSISVFPTTASAQEISSATRQILPIGGNACPAAVATAFTPYIYSGALHSFEFSLPDASYVAIIGSVGNTQVPFNLMTRYVDPTTGTLRMHVDIETTPVVGTLPLQVILLSARTGSPVCMTTVTMSVGSGPVYNTPTAPITPAPVAPVPTPSTPTTPRPTTPEPTTPAPTTPAATSGPAAGGTTGPVISTIQNPLRNVCATQTNTDRLWGLLLILYAVIIGVALWAEFPMSMKWARTPERVATVILGLLLLLLGFWYFVVACRGALWMPLVAFLIAVLGLLAAYWNHPRVTQLLLLQDSKKV